MVDVITLLLAPVAGFFTALWLLLLWVGDGGSVSAGEDDLAMFLRHPDRLGADEPASGFVTMPNHLSTADEMVDWLTKDLPKLTAGMSGSRA
ncbi:hypothetical protein [Microvirga rosea]|uniref:hypothetical protein n=1 Tax=Microvirga rosea TaxID=2715425 RepID=UPI001D09A234|nr:hypothetical protein [Microvirga rosea]MCB8819007.1 hypothetical protein [Microvirga rosea]